MGMVKQYFTELIERAHNDDDEEAKRLLIESGHGDIVDFCFNAAKEYLKLGWSVVPQMPGAKMPLVKWKEFQERLPTGEELNEWFDRWPDAGVAIVLGPISNLFVIDVDGQEAHEMLIQHLGRIPKTLKARSGSRKPYRYHLFFSHPDIPTKAKHAPWHSCLEFRGNRGIVVVPPSIHKSGNRYEWASHRLPYRRPLPLPPKQIREALRANCK